MEPTARQRALAMHEIVRLICFESSEPYFPKKARFASLTALSRTSKIFTEPALDRLWWEQRSLAPLLKCMPEDAWEEHTAGTVVGRNIITTLHLRRPLKSTDLSRVFYYSVRIRKLNLSRYGENKLHHELLRALDMALPIRTLMPKLASLTWDFNKKDVSTMMRHILGPRVRSLHLEFDSTAGLAILPFIRSACPLVSTFSLSLPTDSRTFIPVVSDLVSGLENLTHLSVPSLDQTGLTHIAHLTSLETLSLTSVDDAALPPNFFAGPCFTRLSTLRISCRTAKFCAGILQAISSREFSSLSIYPMFPWTTLAWQHLFNVIHDHMDHKALAALTIEDCDGLERLAEDALPSYRISSEVLRPLLAFRELGHATFQIYPGIDVDDDFLEEMAKAWCGLYCLQLCGEVLIAQPPRATLKCLISFARHCRSLDTLGIRLDVTAAVPPFTQIAGKRLTHRLGYMYLGTSSLRNLWADTEAKVAAFISDLFPKLEGLFTLDGELPEPLKSYRESWNRVGNMVPVFSSMRSREKKLCKEEFNDDSDDEEEEESSDEDESESEVAS
ncbi:hypothetical protein R3P38DRAFT_2852052 [Favolaschia claudopus]|uniref:F-box domain-containing protein n=1 Tax=Favolaschia claudopus TaxID=2862362 RepID=A0AAW0DRP9_9AGAR